MLRSRGFDADSVLGHELQGQRRRWSGRLSARSSVLFICGVSVFLWALIIEAGVHFLK